jgi:glycosyl hydrolase family 44
LTTQRPARGRFRIFVAGTIVGGMLGGLLGVGLTAEILVNHPHFASRLRAMLMPPKDVPTFTIGSLANVVVRVDLSSNGHPISRFIYGVAFADPATLRALGATVNRWGGNSSTRYNWAYGHAWNAARDWEFRNGNGGQPEGRASDKFVTDTLSAGAVPLMTVPSIGFVAKNDDNGTRSVGVPSIGGPPVAPGSSAIAGYDPTTNRLVTSVPSFATKPGPFTLSPPADSAAVYQDEWVHELVQRFGAAPSGVGFFAIDNEPDLWAYTHTDVRPVEMSYADMLSNYEQYALAVKAQDPTALLLGPDVSGWTGYFYSGLDRGYDSYATHSDRVAHGGQAFLPWWLGQVALADRKRGTRSLDLLDVHFYPQAQGLVFPGYSDPYTQALRIRSVRALFDPGYTDESWIGDQVELIPRLGQWIGQDYPGTGIAITEYNWGGEKDASGAVALAEVLGIYGREGVSLATYWTYPLPDSPAGAAFRLYRNYDGKGGTFGDVELPLRISQAGVTAFASRHSDTNEIDVILINEAPNQTAGIHLDLGLSGKQVVTQFQVAPGSSTIVPTPLADLSSPIHLPPYSISLIKVVQG